MANESDCEGVITSPDTPLLVTTAFTPTQGATAYNAAIQMIVLQNSVIWSSFMSILYANIAIFAFIAALLSIFEKVNTAKIVAGILCVFGIVLCIIWLLINRRNFAYHDYWFGWARLAEKSALETEEAMIQVGRSFGSDNKRIRFGDDVKIHAMPMIKYHRIANIVKIKVLVEMAIYIIMAMHFLALIFACIYPTRQTEQRMNLTGVVELQVQSATIKH